MTLPVLGNAASTHTWAAQVSRRTGYLAPLSAENSRKLDNILLHRVWGPLLFLVVVVAVFEVVFSIGQPLSDGFGELLARGGELVRPLLPAGWLQSLVLDGAWKGISSVLVFLPQILLLFLFIGILEDSGYLARAALIADRVMRTTGLNGKAFIPLLSAYACAVPAIMASRTIENKRDRLATILVTPFMTCSARLPVYMLLIAAFIPNITWLHGALGLRTLVMLGLYFAGFIAAMTTAFLLKSSILKSSDTPFILELPQYRMPTVRAWPCGWSIAPGVSAPGGHHYLGGHPGPLDRRASAGGSHSHGQLDRSRSRRQPDRAHGPPYRAGHRASGLQLESRHRPDLQRAGARGHGQHHGHALWQRPGTQALSLQNALHHDITLGGALALMIFFAFAMQCTSTMAVVRRETNSWKWPAFQFTYMLVLAYSSAFVVNRVVTAIFG